MRPIGDRPAEAAPSRDRRLLHLGIVGAVVAFVGLSVLASLALKPFLPADESSNADYALAATDGRIPHIDDPVVPKLPGQRRIPLQYVANHPPLYFLLAGVPLRVGLEVGHPMLGFYGARLLTVLLSAGAVLLTGVLAAVLVRRRGPAVAVGAAAVVATSGWLVMTSGMIHNDGLATALVAAELVATVLVLRRGLHTGLCLLLVATAGLGLLTRISALSVVALSAAALVAAGLLHPVAGRRRGLLRGVAWAAALTVFCALTSGWFYWRNVRLYGDPTAQEYVVGLMRQLGIRRPPPPSFAEVLLDPETYGRQLLRMFGAYAANGLPPALQGPATWAVAAAWLAVAAGVVAVVARLVRAGHGQGADGRPLVEAAVVAVLVLQVVAVFLQIANHVAEGGAANARYVFPAWPVLAVGMAYFICCLPGRLGRPLLALVVLLQAGLTVALLAAQAARWTGGSGPLALDAVPKAVRLSGVPAPEAVVVVLALLVLAGLGAAVAAILLGGEPASDGAAAPPPDAAGEAGTADRPAGVRTPAGG